MCVGVCFSEAVGGLMGSFIYSFLFEGAPLTQEGHAHQVHMALFNTLLADTHTYAYTHTHTLHSSPHYCLSVPESYPCSETVLAGKTSPLKHRRNPPPPNSTGHSLIYEPQESEFTARSIKTWTLYLCVSPSVQDYIVKHL